MVEISAAEQNKEKRIKRNDSTVIELWDNIKCTNIQIIGVPEEEEKEKQPEKIFEEITVKNISKMEKEKVSKVQEAQKFSYRINQRRNTPRQIWIELTKIKFKKYWKKPGKGNKQHKRETLSNYHPTSQQKLCRSSAGKKGVVGHS